MQKPLDDPAPGKLGEIASALPAAGRGRRLVVIMRRIERAWPVSMALILLAIVAAATLQ